MKTITNTPTYALHDGETVTVRTHTPELLEVEAEWQPEDSKPPVHFHPSQDERFEVSEGELNVKLDDGTQVLRAGDVLEIPRGTPHSMWATEHTRASWQVRPALRTADFFAAVDASRRYRKQAKGGMMTPLGAGRVLREYDDVFRMKLPRPMIAALALLGRLRGYPSPS